MKSVKVSFEGVGFCGLLAIAFIVLKLCNVIFWSWWWVLAPIWIPIALVVGFWTVLLAIMIVSGLLLFILSRFSRRKSKKHGQIVDARVKKPESK